MKLYVLKIFPYQHKQIAFSDYIELLCGKGVPYSNQFTKFVSTFPHHTLCSSKQPCTYILVYLEGVNFIFIYLLVCVLVCMTKILIPVSTLLSKNTVRYTLPGRVKTMDDHPRPQALPALGLLYLHSTFNGFQRACLKTVVTQYMASSSLLGEPNKKSTHWDTGESVCRARRWQTGCTGAFSSEGRLSGENNPRLCADSPLLFLVPTLVNTPQWVTLCLFRSVGESVSWVLPPCEGLLCLGATS